MSSPTLEAPQPAITLTNHAIPSTKSAWPCFAWRLARLGYQGCTICAAYHSLVSDTWCIILSGDSEKWQSMQTLAERVRRARAQRGISQQTLANTVGVQRSAVAQWERTAGSHPSMEHLIAISVATGVRLEWLGTGRGPMHCDATVPALDPEEYAQSVGETQCLRAIRAVPPKLRENLVHMIVLIANNFK